MKTTEFNSTITSAKLNESMFKKFGIKVNLDKYTREELENYRNLVRTEVNQTESTAGFNDLLANEDYQKDKHMLALLNTKIKEMLGESKPKYKNVSCSQCGNKFGPGNSGFSSCKEHKGKTAVADDKVAERKLTKPEKKKKEEIVLAIKRDNPEKRKGKGKSSAYAIATAQAKKTAESKDTTMKKTTEAKKAKPDFLDMDKDGNKKEPMKKAVKDSKVKEALKGGQKTIAKAAKPEDKITGADFKALKSKKKKVKEGIRRAHQYIIIEGLKKFIAEDEEGKAKDITAGTDMVNDFTSWMQRVGQYQTKSTIELADSIRANFGQAEADQFKAAIQPALEDALNTLTAARETITRAVAVLAGEEGAEQQMGMDRMGSLGGADNSVGGMENDIDSMNLPPEDDFGASDAAAGGLDSAGRGMRESRARARAKKLAESHSIMSKLAK
jgi:hypothetical protein